MMSPQSSVQKYNRNGLGLINATFTDILYFVWSAGECKF